MTWSLTSTCQLSLPCILLGVINHVRVLVRSWLSSTTFQVVCQHAFLFCQSCHHCWHVWSVYFDRHGDWVSDMSVVLSDMILAWVSLVNSWRHSDCVLTTIWRVLTALSRLLVNPVISLWQPCQFVGVSLVFCFVKHQGLLLYRPLVGSTCQIILTALSIFSPVSLPGDLVVQAFWLNRSFDLVSQVLGFVCQVNCFLTAWQVFLSDFPLVFCQTFFNHFDSLGVYWQSCQWWRQVFGFINQVNVPLSSHSLFDLLVKGPC